MGFAIVKDFRTGKPKMVDTKVLHNVDVKTRRLWPFEAAEYLAAEPHPPKKSASRKHYALLQKEKVELTYVLFVCDDETSCRIALEHGGKHQSFSYSNPKRLSIEQHTFPLEDFSCTNEREQIIGEEESLKRALLSSKSESNCKIIGSSPLRTPLAPFNSNSTKSKARPGDDFDLHVMRRKKKKSSRKSSDKQVEAAILVSKSNINTNILEKNKETLSQELSSIPDVSTPISIPISIPIATPISPSKDKTSSPISTPIYPSKDKKCAECEVLRKEISVLKLEKEALHALLNGRKEGSCQLHDGTGKEVVGSDDQQILCSNGKFLKKSKVASVELSSPKLSTRVLNLARALHPLDLHLMCLDAKKVSNPRYVFDEDRLSDLCHILNTMRWRSSELSKAYKQYNNSKNQTDPAGTKYSAISLTLLRFFLRKALHMEKSKKSKLSKQRLKKEEDGSGSVGGEDEVMEEDNGDECDLQIAVSDGNNNHQLAGPVSDESESGSSGSDTD